jgi:hypothetical protein
MKTDRRYLGAEHALITTLTVRSAVELEVGLLTNRILLQSQKTAAREEKESSANKRRE